MKNITKILALVLVLSMTCVIFASCGTTLSGEYEGPLGATYEFKGKDFTFSVLGFELEGTYEIDGDTIKFDFDEDNDYLEPEMSFEKTDDGIKIGGTEYEKK